MWVWLTAKGVVTGKLEGAVVLAPETKKPVSTLAREGLKAD